MKSLIFIFAFSLAGTAFAAKAPTENPYDVLGKTFSPFFNVLLADGRKPEKAMTLDLRVSKVEGRLPKDFVGGKIRASVQSPDKVKMIAPVFGEDFTVCRIGNKVWATPGSKVEYLLSQFKKKPPPSPKKNTPLTIPVSSQQAVFLIALFSIDNPKVAIVDTVNGEDVRILSGGLMEQLATSAKAEDFKASIAVNSEYRPVQMEIVRKDFRMTVDFENLRFLPSLPKSNWEVPSGATDVYYTTADKLEQVLYVVINSLQSDADSMPWLSE
ncbi:MAG: hypothetical protein ACK5LK_00905 [Chthoniobacterales bacterium]